MEAHSLPRDGLQLPRSRRLLAPLSDERLVEHVRRGNDAAFETIYDRHHRGILSFCRHMLASAEEAEDAVQHTFIQAYDAIRRDARELKLKAWLYAIARNRCLSVLRARREQPAELDEIPTAGLADAVQERSDLREMLADIRALPDDQRAALVLSELGDLTHAEIATVVGCEASKVKSLVFQARSALIENRKAREVPCQEIREQLATATGGVLRRGPLRRHLRQCEGCAEFREQVTRQRRAMALLLPVVPTGALKQGALAALGVGGGGGAGGIGALLGGTVTKAVLGLAVTGAAVTGGVVVTENASPGATGTPPAAVTPAPAAAAPVVSPTRSVTTTTTSTSNAPARRHAHHGAAATKQPGARAHSHGHSHGTTTAPGLNGTAGNGHHTGSSNGHANGRPATPPKRGARGLDNRSPSSHGNGPPPPKPAKPPKPVHPTPPQVTVPDLMLPGDRAGAK